MLKLKIQLQGLDSTFLFQARLDQLPQDSIRVEACDGSFPQRPGVLARSGFGV